jgi:hypothetical protein
VVPPFRLSRFVFPFFFFASIRASLLLLGLLDKGLRHAAVLFVLRVFFGFAFGFANLDLGLAFGFRFTFLIGTLLLSVSFLCLFLRFSFRLFRQLP